MTNTSEAQRKRVPIPEIAVDLGVSVNTVYEYLRQGTIPHVKLGKLYIVPRTAYDKWLETAGSVK